MSIPEINLPASKSIAARALILEKIFNDKISVENVPNCDDSNELKTALRELDIALKTDFKQDKIYNLGTGGTSVRFFLALLASLENARGVIDCSDAMRRRPISPLVDALRSAGADIKYIKDEGQLPVRVKGKILNGVNVKLQQGISSQFGSALMMASLIWDAPLNIDFSGEISAPYLEMTRKIIDEFENLGTESEKTKRKSEFYIERDWSATSFFYEYALLFPGRPVKLPCMTRPADSIQGDSYCVKLFDGIGVKSYFGPEGECVIEGVATEIEDIRRAKNPVKIDMRDVPDIVPPIAIGMAIAGIRFEISGISHLRHKESDRIEALCEELLKLGFVVNVFQAGNGNETMVYDGKKIESQCNMLSSHSDHRIAMALWVAREKVGNGYKLEGKDCVSKSFPDFFKEFAKLEKHR